MRIVAVRRAGNCQRDFVFHDWGIVIVFQLVVSDTVADEYWKHSLGSSVRRKAQGHPVFPHYESRRVVGATRIPNQKVILSQLNARDIWKRLQVSRLILATRARRSRDLHSRSQTVPIELAGDVMCGVVRPRSSRAASFKRIGGEILDDLAYTIDADS